MNISAAFPFLRGAIFLLAITLCIGHTAPPSGADPLPPPLRVLIIPISVNAGEETFSLKKGIDEILTARLSETGRTIILRPEDAMIPPSAYEKSLSNDAARAIGQKAGANHVIFGTITLFGESASTHLWSLDVQSGETNASFSGTSGRKGEVLEHITRFASDARAALLPETDAPGPAAALNEKEETAAPHVARRAIGPTLADEVTGLSTGDFNGDGRTEVAVMTGQTLTVYRIDGEKWTPLVERKGERGLFQVAISAFDLNGNGTDEIYISRTRSSSPKPHAIVLEWDGKNLRPLVTGAPFYISVSDLTGKGAGLYGQRHSRIKDAINLSAFFDDAPSRLILKGKKLTAAEKIPLPPLSHVYNTLAVKIGPEGEGEIAQLSEKQKLRLMDRKGKIHWEDAESYGGTQTYLEVTDPGSPERTLRYYLPVRMIQKDINGDGKMELITVKNHETFESIARLKSLKEGKIVCLAWDGLNLSPLWQSLTVKTFISDFGIGDIHADGTRKLVYAAVKTSRTGYRKGETTLIVDTIPPASMQ